MGGLLSPFMVPLAKNQSKLSSFKLDVYPVTNAQYLAFVKKYPAYSRSKMKGLFADKSYLSQWESDFNYGKNNLSNAPITNVSWFAAKKYCECQGKRLPSMDEWEYVAMADEKRIDARTKEEFNKYIMSWYEKPKPMRILLDKPSKIIGVFMICMDWFGNGHRTSTVFFFRANPEKIKIPIRISFAEADQ